jgi:RNA polymerase sigma factor (sigma-70 family)
LGLYSLTNHVEVTEQEYLRRLPLANTVARDECHRAHSQQWEDEAVCEARMVLWIEMRRFDPEQNDDLEGYLAARLHLRMRDLFRKLGIKGQRYDHGFRHLQIVPGAIRDVPIVPGYRVSDQQPYTFISPAIARAIRCLEPQHRTVIERMMIDGAKQAEVAREMQLSEGRIWQLKDEALQFLRHRLVN